MDVNVDDSELEIPTMDQAVGINLIDGSMSIQVGTGTAPIMTMKIPLII